MLILLTSKMWKPGSTLEQPVVLNAGYLHWESSTLTITPLLHIFDNASKKIILISIFHLNVFATLQSGSRNGPVFKVTCYNFNPWCILNEMIKLSGPFGSIPHEPWHPGKGNKLDDVIHLNWGKVYTHASCKRTRTWKILNRGIKNPSFQIDYD